MHIMTNRLAEPLTSAEQEHLKSCEQCTFEQEAINQLKCSVEEIKLLHPPESDWLAIQQRMAKKKQVKRTSFMQFFISAAASFFFIAVGWLTWNNYQLQGQLEQVLHVNQTLELQLMQNGTPTFHQTQLLSKIRLIDLQLVDTATPAEKISLLKQRQKFMAEMVINKNGKHHEYSI
jgi:hypothetical protein